MCCPLDFFIHEACTCTVVALVVFHISQNNAQERFVVVEKADRGVCCLKRLVHTEIPKCIFALGA